ncbi:MAG TPA: S1 RNA-binding domain-containing protein [Planctomycetaceae bacterium]
MSPNDPTPQETQAAAPGGDAGQTPPEPQAAGGEPPAPPQDAPAAPQENPPVAAVETPPAAPPAEPPAEPQADRPRVTLNPTGPQDAKPVPSLQGDEPAAPSRDFPDIKDQVPEDALRAPGQPIAVSGVDIPRSAELDPEMEAELAAAMAANPLSAMINEKAAAAGPPQPIDIEALQPGTRLQGKVQHVGEETVFVDLGLRSPGMLQTRQFPPEKPPEVGQEVEVVVDNVDVGEGSVLVSLPKARRKPGGNWDAVSQGQVVDAMVTKTNKGGLEVTVGSLRGFLPASQVDLGFVENLEAYVGQKLTCVITEVNPQKRNLVLSRRAYLQQERQEKEKELWHTLSVGQSLTGTVKTVKDYGAFVDLGGVDGFLHVGEISWNRVNHPSDVLKVGDVIQVRILKLDSEAKKIGLGMKQLQQNPWASIDQRYPVGATVSGRVTRTTDFGAFVELEQGVEGLIHISELEHRRVGRVTDVVKEGDTVDAKVLAVDPGRKRISLSLKALKSKPEPEHAPVAAEPYERKRKGPLRGGREGDQAGRGGLFGNPDDFRR